MEGNKSYKTLVGRRVNMQTLDKKERDALAAVIEAYRSEPEWTTFANWWMSELAERDIDHESPVYTICDDLEARLGIAQGKTSPPDYRHHLAALIEEQFGSRYQFCKEVGIDQAQLSRVLRGQEDFSIERLSKALQALHASLVVQSEEESREYASPEKATKALAKAI